MGGREVEKGGRICGGRELCVRDLTSRLNLHLYKASTIKSTCSLEICT